MDKPNLPPDTLRFFKASLHDQSLSELARNNMANVLMNQETRDPQLYREFIAIVDDPTQSDTWRDYAIQFLANNYAIASKPRVVLDKLGSLTRHGREHLAQQAMTMLSTMEDENTIKLDKSYDRLLVENLASQAATPKMQIAALSLLGQRQAVEHLELIRQYAAKPSTVQRVALATLGQLGDATDLPLIESHLKSPDRLLRLAAKGALERLKQRHEVAGEGSLGGNPLKRILPPNPPS